MASKCPLSRLWWWWQRDMDESMLVVVVCMGILWYWGEKRRRRDKCWCSDEVRLVFGLKENLDFLGKMMMIIWVCVCLFHKKISGFGWKENVMMKILGIGFLDVNFFNVWWNFLGKMLNAQEFCVLEFLWYGFMFLSSCVFTFKSETFFFYFFILFLCFNNFFSNW